jgi:pectin methylesterase-like acyl-CoA thioesterase
MNTVRTLWLAVAAAATTVAVALPGVASTLEPAAQAAPGAPARPILSQAEAAPFT